MTAVGHRGLEKSNRRTYTKPKITLNVTPELLDEYTHNVRLQLPHDPTASVRSEDTLRDDRDITLPVDQNYNLLG